MSTSPGHVNSCSVQANKNRAAKDLEPFEISDSKDRNGEATENLRPGTPGQWYATATYKNIRGVDEISISRLDVTGVGRAGVGIRGALGVHVLQI